MDSWPLSEKALFGNITINGTPGCSLSWNRISGEIDLYTSTGVHDRQLKIRYILDVDISKRAKNKLRLAFAPAAAPTIDCQPELGAMDAEGHLDPFDFALATVNAGLAPSPIPTLFTTKKLVILKLNLQWQVNGWEKIIKYLTNYARTFEWGHTSSLQSKLFFTGKKDCLVPTADHKEEFKSIFESGVLKGWQKEKYVTEF